MSFEQRFTKSISYKDDYKTKKRIYKYNNDFEDEFSYSEIYAFFKKYINHLKNSYPNLFKTIILYARQRNFNQQTEYTYSNASGLIHKIFYISMDASGNTIKKEKYTENIDVVPPFEIIFEIETIDIPIQFTQNNLKNVLRPTFKVKREYSPRTFDGSVEKRLYFYTTSIEYGEETLEEIYNFCVPYLVNFQCLYKNDRLDGELITKSCYELTLITEPTNRTIYYSEIDTNGDTIQENNIYENLNPNVQKPYKIQLTITLIRYPQQQINDEEIINEEIENIPPDTKKCFKQETCTICISSPPNVIFTDCLHICICSSCNTKLSKTVLINCPLCRTPAFKPRLII